MRDRIKKILIIRLSAIGDTIQTLPLANALKRNFPDAELHWVVEDKAKFFVEQNKNIDNVFVVPKNKWKSEKNFFKIMNDFSFLIDKLRHEKYDIALDVQQLFKSGVILGLCGAKRKISMNIAREFSKLFANELIISEHKLFDNDYHVVKRYQEFLRYLKCEDEQITFELEDFSDEVKNKVNELLSDIDKDKPIIVLAPATTWENKHWDINNWKKLFEHFADKANIVFTGTEKNLRLVADIVSDSNKNYINLVGKTNLEELSQVLKVSNLVVCPDSGTSNIAWAVESPYVISVFCATSSKRTGPIGEKCFTFDAKNVCKPCNRRKCPLKRNKNICTSAVAVDDVIKKIEQLLNL